MITIILLQWGLVRHPTKLEWRMKGSTFFLTLQYAVLLQQYHSALLGSIRNSSLCMYTAEYSWYERAMPPHPLPGFRIPHSIE